MATAYVAQNAYVEVGYVELETAPTESVMFDVPIPGTSVATSSTVTPSTARQAPVTTLFGQRSTASESRPVQDPYAIVPAVVLSNFHGVRIYSAIHVDPLYTVPPHTERSVRLLAVDAIAFGQSGAGSTLVTRVSSLEQPSWSFTLANDDGAISRLLANEAVLGHAAALYRDYGGGVAARRVRGEVSRVQLTSRRAVFTVTA